MMFKLSNELLNSKIENLKNGEEVECYCLSLIHNKKTFYDFLYLTPEKAKEMAEKHAHKNSRLKVRYVVKSGILKGDIFKSGYTNTVRIEGEKTGKEVTWTDTK